MGIIVLMHTTRTPLRWLLPVFFLLCLLYAWATPPFEASDELWHFGMVDYLADTGQLPVQVVGLETPWEQEGSQPPLYYALAAVLVRPIDRSDFDALRQPNPHVLAGIPGAVGNKNLVLHDTPFPPLQQTALAVYLVRLFSIGLGCVTVYAVYQAAALLAPERPFVPLLAAALTAFNPMFLFITASVNNDNLVTALGSLVVWLTLVTLHDGFSTRRSLIIALLIALAALSKLSGLILVPFVALSAFYTAYRRRDWRGLLILGLSMAVFWSLLAGWWYLRNLTLYGELFGTRMMAAVAGAREGVFTLQTLLDEFQGFRFAYWGLFGAVNIMTFRPFYDVMDVLTVLALVGLALRLWHVRHDRDRLIRVLLPGVLILLGAFGVINWTAQTYASQGRLLFPYVAAISPLLALGLLEWLHRLNWERAVWLPVAALDTVAVIIPFATIAPAYTPPPPLSALPTTAQGVYARFGDVTLIGYETPDRRYLPRENVPITLYWQVAQPSDEDFSLYLHAVDNRGSVIGKVDSYPGAGRQRTSTWEPGLYADTYAIPLDETPVKPSRLRIQVGWWDYDTGKLIEPLDADGNRLNSVMLNAGAIAPETVMESVEEMVAASEVDFGGLITLSGYRLDGAELALVWQVNAAPAADYTVFAQILDEASQVIGQGDAPPDMPTGYWQPGERFVTRHTILYPELPQPGEYPLIVGWYNPLESTRLPTAAPDNAYLLTTVTIP